MAEDRKLIVIVGITGNQGGSVAKTWLSDPKLRETYRIRGISRNPSSEASRSLLDAGVEEMVQADLHQPASLDKAFQGADLIFSVTDFWHPYHDPANQAKARELGKSIGEYAYDLEYEQGRNIADAAAKVPTLTRFVASTLSSPKKWSNGAYDKLWHFESKADMITYIKEAHPALHAKTSTLNMGVFYTSWDYAPITAPKKVADGHHVMSLPCNPHTPVPLVDARNDTGPFVRALAQCAPGINLLGETSMRSWDAYMRLWGELKGVPRSEYREVSIQSYDDELPGGFGRELADMFHYMGTCGYDGGDPTSMRKEQLPVDIPDLTTAESYILGEDWSPVGIKT